jgi:Family of unknown function (DUF6521)
MTADTGQALPGPVGRPTTDARALFNPAFVAALIGRAAEGHQNEREAPLPVALGYLIAPLVLHTPTREALPRVNARLAKWADDHQLVRAELRWRAPQLVEVTRRALRFGLRHDLIALVPRGIDPGPALARLPAPQGAGAADCWRKAQLLGRWLPRAGPPATVLALLGVRP